MSAVEEVAHRVNYSHYTRGFTGLHIAYDETHGGDVWMMVDGKGPCLYPREQRRLAAFLLNGRPGKFAKPWHCPDCGQDWLWAGASDCIRKGDHMGLSRADVVKMATQANVALGEQGPSA